MVLIMEIVLVLVIQVVLLVVDPPLDFLEDNRVNLKQFQVDPHLITEMQEDLDLILLRDLVVVLVHLQVLIHLVVLVNHLHSYQAHYLH